jgi:amidohydrolase
MRTELLEAIETYGPELTEIRRDIHQHPEMGFEETRTAALVARKLSEWGVEVVEGVGRTGVVGTIRGKHGGNRAIGLRADMDALPIHEVDGRAHRSQNPGVMHACGHDGHTAMLLGAARYLSEHRDFGGVVHVIFQPAEEGRGGGLAMVEDGLFERFPVEAVYGMHNAPTLPAGVFATNVGPLLAAVGFFRTTFIGNGGHGGAAPQDAAETTLAVGQYLSSVASIVSRNLKPSETAVVSVGSISAGDERAPNVIPARAVVTGTWRCFNTQAREVIERRLEELAKTAAAAFGCQVEFVNTRVTPPLLTTRAETEISLAAARALVGDIRVDPAMPPITGGEDFAYMLEKKPGGFVMIGGGVGPNGVSPQVHTPEYDFNDGILTLGAGYWVSLVHEALGA